MAYFKSSFFSIFAFTMDVIQLISYALELHQTSVSSPTSRKDKLQEIRQVVIIIYRCEKQCQNPRDAKYYHHITSLSPNLFLKTYSQPICIHFNFFLNFQISIAYIFMSPYTHPENRKLSPSNNRITRTCIQVLDRNNFLNQDTYPQFLHQYRHPYRRHLLCIPIRINMHHAVIIVTQSVAFAT